MDYTISKSAEIETPTTIIVGAKWKREHIAVEGSEILLEVVSRQIILQL